MVSGCCCVGCDTSGHQAIISSTNQVPADSHPSAELCTLYLVPTPALPHRPRQIQAAARGFLHTSAANRSIGEVIQ